MKSDKAYAAKRGRSSMDQSPQQDLEEINSLETPSTVIEPQPPANVIEPGSSVPPPIVASSADTPALQSPDVPTPGQKPPPSPRKLRFLNFFTRVNIYLLLFILVVIVAVIVVIVAVQKNKQSAVTGSINIQTLTPEALAKLNGGDAKLGDPKQTLSVESNAVFAGKVLVRGSLDVAGSIRVGGPVSLPGLTVAGTSNFDQVTANGLSVSGNTTVQGQLTIQKGLTVGGAGTFTGPISAPQLSIDVLVLNKDLQLNRHIDAGGGTPSKTNGSALGSGGTASNNGTDTAGTVTINTGTSPPAGCFITINFTQKFNATPHVVITPASSDTGGLAYYVNRNTASFSICANNPAASKNYVFDYIAID